MQTNEVADAFLRGALRTMRGSSENIHRCLARLTPEQMLYRGGEHENSIVNLLLHLEGNLRQWILHGIGGQPDVRVRDAEFARTPEGSPAEAVSRFDATVNECYAVLEALTPERLVAIIDPQPGGGWGPVAAIEALVRVVSHLQLHTGQIILLTKQRTAQDLDLSIPRKR